MAKVTDQIIDFAFTNNIAIAIIAAVVSAAILWAIGRFFIWLRDEHDSKKIYEFLRRSAIDTRYQFRSTHAISSGTKIPEIRVSGLCSKHKKICRNGKEKQSWRLADKS